MPFPCQTLLKESCKGGVIQKSYQKRPQTQMQDNLENSYDAAINFIWFMGTCADFPEVAICCPKILCFWGCYLTKILQLLHSGGERGPNSQDPVTEQSMAVNEAVLAHALPRLQHLAPVKQFLRNSTGLRPYNSESTLSLWKALEGLYI